MPSIRRAAEERDELATLDHSITSSARASSVGGMVRLSALAVLRLITSLKRIARAAGVDIAFVEADEFLFGGGGRAAGAVRRLRQLGLDRLAARTAGLVLFQRYMILKVRS